MANLHQLKLEICDIGRRIYNKGFAAGNDGNISYRLGPNEVLCTPTMVSKGFLKPDDLCTVDMEGNQKSGQRKRTSEIMLHLAIMKKRSDVKSVVHCHPPHATAFADCPRADSAVRAARGRGVPGRRADHQVRDPRRPAVCRHDPAVRREEQRDHSGQPRHGQLRRNGGAGLLVDRDSRRLLPDADAGQGPGTRQLLQRGEGARTAGFEDQVGLQGRPARPGHGELRHLCERRVPRQLEGHGRPAAGLRCSSRRCGPNARHSRQRRRPATDSRSTRKQLVQTITDRVMAALQGR